MQWVNLFSTSRITENNFIIMGGREIYKKLYFWTILNMSKYLNLYLYFVFFYFYFNFHFHSGGSGVQKCVRLDQIPAARGLGGHWGPEEYFVSNTFKPIQIIW